MPCIHISLSNTVNDVQKTAIKSRLGKAIELVPGKTEAWLMVVIQDGVSIYFKGDDSASSAYVEVSVLGKDDPKGFERLSAAICQILQQEAGISGDRVYIKYSSTANWGWNGGNF